jgi:anti-sigma factor RsiW
MMAHRATDDDLLKGYLLGRLAPESRDTVETRIFSDDRIFWEHLCLVEEELIDDYAAGALAGPDAADFERSFLCTDERRAKLELARALRAYAARPETARPRAWDWLRRPIPSPAWALVAAAALLLVLPAAVWQLAAGRGPAREVSAWLSPGLVRDAGGELKRVTLASDCHLARLRLEPTAAEYPTYEATLHEVAGDAVWSQGRLAARPVDGKVAVTLALPCELLRADDYYVTLAGESPGEAAVPLDRYDFRVLRK